MIAETICVNQNVAVNMDGTRNPKIVQERTKNDNLFFTVIFFLTVILDGRCGSVVVIKTLKSAPVPSRYKNTRYLVANLTQRAASIKWHMEILQYI